jgi:hypothetical protein
MDVEDLAAKEREEITEAANATSRNYYIFDS